MMEASSKGYTPVSKILHWLIAASILGLIGLGWWMVGLSYYDKWYHQGLELHRSIGSLALALASFFLIWKIFAPKPPLQRELLWYEIMAAKVVHGLLLVAMFLAPASGYIISTSAGASFTFFGLFDIPAIFKVANSSRDLAISVHYFVTYGIGIIALFHAGAALKHQLLDGHNTLKRML
ncbi:cytochrome b [Sneathiella aquimaris]|uniref:cytochrome b n=1 Tax=Sneathiella aquimaris TaxID=2599305 RepID=UPI00146F1718|nr:cytochrome b [Sneathiella aquimaris]